MRKISRRRRFTGGWSTTAGGIALALLVPLLASCAAGVEEPARSGDDETAAETPKSGTPKSGTPEAGTPEAEAPAIDRGAVVMVALSGSDVTGTLEMRQVREGLRIEGEISGLAPGDHGFHIHQHGDLRADDGSGTGDHYAPEGSRHGGPDDQTRHAGDMGNITADDGGTAPVSKVVADLRLDDVIGRAIVVHQGRDDLESQPSGGAGDPVAAGVIGIAGGESSGGDSRPTGTGRMAG